MQKMTKLLNILIKVLFLILGILLLVWSLQELNMYLTLEYKKRVILNLLHNQELEISTLTEIFNCITINAGKNRIYSISLTLHSMLITAIIMANMSTHVWSGSIGFFMSSFCMLTGTSLGTNLSTSLIITILSVFIGNLTDGDRCRSWVQDVVLSLFKVHENEDEVVNLIYKYLVTEGVIEKKEFFDRYVWLIRDYLKRYTSA